MSFDWKQESKEIYYKMAEQQIEAAGFDDLLEVDRTSFGLQGNEIRVFIKPIHRKGNTRRWWEAKRAIPNIKEQPSPKDEYGRKRKTIFIHSHMSFEMQQEEGNEL